MLKSWLTAAAALVGGALIGGFLGRAIAVYLPQGRLQSMLARELVAGMDPARLNLGLVDLTFGCKVHFNMTSVLGVVLAALLLRFLLD